MGECEERFPKPPWRKILYRKQPYDDNYVDSTFLDSLITNANVRSYKYSDLCVSTVCISQHISCLGIFVVAWKLVRASKVSPQCLMALDVSMLVMGFILRFLLSDTTAISFSALKSVAVVIGVLWILSPVLLTLTKAFSDDTVFFLTSFFMLLHVVLHDYLYIHRAQSKVDEPLSGCTALNAAMVAAVLLASRLDSGEEVFAFMFFGIESLALSPIARRYIWLKSNWAYVYVLTPSLIITTALLLRFVAPIAIALYLLSMLFITLVAPSWLIRVQKYKNEIRGPWDIAHVQTKHN